MILWLTGNSGSGKTTLGKLLVRRFDAILLDGDTMRSTISLDAGFNKEDREEHNLRVARLAQELDRQGKNVIVTVIAPFESTRIKIDKMITPIWVHLYKPSLPDILNKPYEEPNNSIASINTDEMTILESYNYIVEILQLIQVG